MKMHFENGYPVNHARKLWKRLSESGIRTSDDVIQKISQPLSNEKSTKNIDFSNFRHYLNVQSAQQNYNIDTCLMLCSDYGVSGGVFM